MNTILFCMIQMTIVAAAAWSLSKVLMKHMPQLSAQLSLLGIVLSTITLLASVVELPRFFVFKTINKTQVTDNTIDDKQTDSLQQHTTTSVPLIDLKNTIKNAKPITVSHAMKKKRIVNYFGIAASVLFAMMILRFLVGFVAVWRLKKTSQICDDPDVQHQLHHLTAQHKLHFPVKVMTNTTLSSPCVTWLNRGIIYLPADFTQWSQDERATVLAHEYSHIIRGDAKCRLVAEFCFILICFHPLLLLLKRQLTFGQEAATDRKAIELLGSLKQYLTGLSKFALRMDSQQSQSFVSVGVSISINNMIRRIKMLNLKNQPLRRWQEWTIVTTLIIGSLGVAACSLSAEEPEKQTTSIKSKTTTTTTKMFQRKKSEPWKNIGQSDGYFRSLPQVMNKDIWYQSYWNSITFSFVKEKLKNPAPENSLMKLSSHLTLVEAGVAASLSEIPKKRQQGKEKHQWQFGTVGIKLSFNKEFDWKKVSEHVAWYNFDSTGTIKKKFVKLGKSKGFTFKSQQFTSEGKESHSEEMMFIKALWNKIDGGALGLAFRIQGDFKPDAMPEEKEPSIESDLQAITFTCEAMALGIDREEKGNKNHIRLVFVPKEEQTATEMKRLVNTFLSNLDKQLAKGKANKKDEATTAKEKKYFKQFRSDIASMKVTTENLEGTDYQVVVVRGAWHGIPLSLK